MTSRNWNSLRQYLVLQDKSAQTLPSPLQLITLFSLEIQGLVKIYMCCITGNIIPLPTPASMRGFKMTLHLLQSSSVHNQDFKFYVYFMRKDNITINIGTQKFSKTWSQTYYSYVEYFLYYVLPFWWFDCLMNMVVDRNADKLKWFL